MGKLSLLAGVAACSGALAVAAFAGASTVRSTGSHGAGAQSVHYLANGWINDNGVVYHQPHYMRTRFQPAPHGMPDIGNMSYHGGPVQVHPHIYLVFWGWKAAGDPNHVRPVIHKFERGVGGSAWLNTVSQYYEMQSGNQVNIQNNKFELRKGGVWNDNVNAIPAHPTDAQVAAEATNLMNKVGYDPDGSYVVLTAHGHSSAGFGTSYCAYHSDVSTPSGIIAYHNEPYMPDAGQSCGANIVNPGTGGVNDGVSIVEGHELAEAQTDPQPFSGWYGPESEIGDVCAWQNLQNTTLTTGVFPTQPLWSNASNSCVQSYP